jgi:branched-subunit amino acid aminotransferase/4-amino-4-deoxychorismate lyase
MEIDGVAATVERLSAAALAGYGHFTAMQVRGDRVRGLDLHLTRLDAANRELFGAGLGPATVRAVDTSGLRSFRGAFVTNARGIAPVGQTTTSACRWSARCLPR